MSRQLTRKKLKKDEFVEAAFSAEQWIEENWRMLVLWVSAAVVGVVVVIAVVWWMNVRRERANELLAEGLQKYREAATAPAELDEALPLLARSEEAGGGIGWLGGYYRAAALVRAGQPEQAGEILEGLLGDAPDDELAQAALALKAKVRLAAGHPDEAITILGELADRGGAYAPQSLLTLASLQRQQGRAQDAADTYRRLLEAYPEDPAVPQAQQALQQLSR